MKGLAIISNILIPGVGSFMLGFPGQGIGQILIWGLGFMLTVFTFGFGGVIGIPLMLGAWIWGIVTVAGGAPQNVNVTISNNNSGGGTPSA